MASRRPPKAAGVGYDFSGLRVASVGFAAEAQADTELVGKLECLEPVCMINTAIIFVVAVEIEQVCA